MSTSLIQLEKNNRSTEKVAVVVAIYIRLITVRSALHLAFLQAALQKTDFSTKPGTSNTTLACSRHKVENLDFQFLQMKQQSSFKTLKIFKASTEHS